MNKTFIKLYFIFVRIWEVIKKIDFSSNKNIVDNEFNSKFVFRATPSGDFTLKKILKQLMITSNDAILDVGSGKGSALYIFTKFPFCKITGVEISSQIAKIAQENFKSLKINNVNIINIDVLQFTDFDSYNYFYLYNPFPMEILLEFITLLVNSYKKNKRKIILIYNNPIYENIIKQKGFIEYRVYKEKYGHGIKIFVLQ